jgi:hypothetical protein
MLRALRRQNPFSKEIRLLIAGLSLVILLIVLFHPISKVKASLPLLGQTQTENLPAPFRADPTRIKVGD